MYSGQIHTEISRNFSEFEKFYSFLFQTQISKNSENSETSIEQFEQKPLLTSNSFYQIISKNIPWNSEKINIENFIQNFHKSNFNINKNHIPRAFFQNYDIDNNLLNVKQVFSF